MPNVTPIATSRALRMWGSRPKPREISADVAAKYGSLCPKIMAAKAYAATAAMADVAAGMSAFRARHAPERNLEEKNFLTFCQPLGSGVIGNGVVCMRSAMLICYELNEKWRKTPRC